MLSYCPKCGAKLNTGASFCQNCGQRIDNYDEMARTGQVTRPPAYFVPNVTPPTPSPELKAAADGLAVASLGFAKILLVFLLGLIATSTAVGAAGALGAAAYSFYYFASGTAISLPVFISQTLFITSISDWALLFCGLTAIFVAAILIALTSTLYSCIKSVVRKK